MKKEASVDRGAENDHEIAKMKGKENVDRGSECVEDGAGWCRDV